MLGVCYPGDSVGFHKIGSMPDAGVQVGFGSFLGLQQGGVSGENLPFLQSNCINIRSDLMTHASDDPIMLDLVTYRWDIPQMLVAHGTTNKPWGANEGFADGSTRWYNYSDFNSSYSPTYEWDRKCRWFLYNGTNGQFLLGGYPGYYQYDYVHVPPEDWFGIEGGYTQLFTPF
jgi:hypothetical protein